MEILTAPNVGAVSGALSAIFWIWSAVTNVPLHRLGALSGPRNEDLRPFRRQAVLNALAAVLSAVAAGCTAYALKWPSPPTH